MIKKMFRWIPALFIIAMSWYLSSKSQIELMPTFFNADKLVHLVCFAGLAFWVAFGFNLKKYSQFWISSIFVSVVLLSLLLLCLFFKYDLKLLSFCKMILLGITEFLIH